MTRRQWTIPDVADHCGVTAATVRKYRSEGRLPAPDGQVGRTPWWRMETITDWHAARPGQGARTDLREQ